MSTQATATMTNEQLQAEVARLQAFVTAGVRGNKGHVTSNGLSLIVVPVGEKDSKGEEGKGNLRIYGLGRFPYSPYLSQIEKLLDAADEIRAFIATNRSKFAVKGE